MKLRLENRDIRIRLSEREWDSLQQEGQLQQKFDFGLKKDVSFRIILSDHNSFVADDFQIQIYLEQATVRQQQRKKDPYWIYVNEKGLQLSLDVDIIPEEKR